MNALLRDDDQSFVQEALPSFISEATDQLATLEELLLQLEQNPGERSLLDALFRCAHTIKGSAGIFGLESIVDFTHHVETLLDRLREGELALTPDMDTLLLRCCDAIRLQVAAASNPALDDASARATRLELAGRLAAFSGESPGAATAAAAVSCPAPDAARWSVQARFGADTFSHGMDPLAIFAYLQERATLETLDCDTAAVPPLEQLDPERCHLTLRATLADSTREAIESAFSFAREDCELQVLPQALEPGTEAADTADGAGDTPGDRAGDKAEEADATGRPGNVRTARAAADDGRYIRVQADRLDAVINLVGELVVASEGAELLARQRGDTAQVEANQQIGRLVEEIRNGALQLRMVPIGDTFSRFRRVVRDTAAELGKDVVLEISGAETELDKSVVEKIADPLMHLVRNALDHGLETPRQRLAAGKPARGTLRLDAQHETGTIVIRVEDDGAGVNRKRVLERAWERGLVEPGVTPPDAEILRLIFEAGFSTAGQVTNLSGRGVGMDVVRSNIEALRGTVQVASTEGQGMSVTIRLPLTLAIIDGFLTQVGDVHYVLPLAVVSECIDLPRECSAQGARVAGTFDLRGEVLPYLDLAQFYGTEPSDSARRSLVVVRQGPVRIGLVVDRLLGEHQTVIKPLASIFKPLEALAGSTILGSGDVALVLDMQGLMAAATRPESARLH